MKKINLTNTVFPLTQLSPSEKSFQDSVKEFTHNHVLPLMSEMDEKEALDGELIKKISEEGLMSIEIPGEFGGGDGTFFKTIIAITELSKVDPSVAVFVDVQNTLVNKAILKWGTKEQKSHFLPMLANGEIGAFSLTEQEAGSDAYALTTIAKKTDGGFLLSGEKIFVTNAAEANIFIIFATTDPAKQREGISAFILDKHQAEGLIVHEREKKLGIKASSTCKLSLKEVFVKKDHVLGKIGGGSQIALDILTDGRIGIAAQMLGCSEGALDSAIEYSKKRKQFGSIIASYQGVNFQLAEMYTEINASKLLVYNAARLSETNPGSMEHFSYASMSKFYASKVAESVTSRALDIFGGIGYMRGTPIEKLFRDAKVGKIYEGTSNIQLLSIAKMLVRQQIV